MLQFLFWFAAGLVAALPLLLYAQSKDQHSQTQLFGCSLIIAALVYVGFALAWGDNSWLLIEFAGVLMAIAVYRIAIKTSILWVAAGWLLHPIWDMGLHLYGPGQHIAPDWYAIACMSFDLAVAGYIVYRAKPPGEHLIASVW